MENAIIDEKIKKFRDLVTIQDDSSTGPDPYMAGMYNGMEFFLSVLENGRAPVFKHFDEIAGVWVKDSPPTDAHILGSSGEVFE